ncbi:MAG: phosphoserine phosphatase SerB [Deltaproteobacteria bacterium]|nr:phosphoserine phosphatase SerB [Deltaproteobacteria bacterium]
MAASEIILVNISGEDRPGVTSAITAIFANHHVNILDVGQAVIHDTLSLGFLIELPATEEASPILKELVFKAYELDIKINFTPTSHDDYHQWVSGQGKARFIITMLGHKLTAQQLAEVTCVIHEHGLNIDFISRLSGRIPLEESDKPSRACVELSVRGEVNHEEIKTRLMDIAHRLRVDIAFQVDNLHRRNRRLVCFDMDSTLIQAEVIDILADAAGAGEEVRKITEAAMAGELDFSESFRRRVALLEGLEESRLQQIAESLPLTDGAERLVTMLKQLGYKTAILSGGFTFFGRYLQRKLGIDFVHANQLEIREGRLTGKHVGAIVDGQKKAELLQFIAQQEGIELEQTIAIGDGANDLPMLKLAGLGIAFHAKPVVQQNAEHALSTLGLDGVLYFLGFRDRDVVTTP